MIPSNVDCIIIGTGLTNSIIAAACSRIGKSVLHVDKNKYYGEEWTSFTFQQILDWIRENYPKDGSLNDVPEELLNKSRMFCIDLCPRLLYSNGPMVNLLVKSNVSRYHEFKNNIRILSMVDNEIHVMPCRRSDVFNSPLLSNLIDKRRLMKLIELCIRYEPDNIDSDTVSSETREIMDNKNKPISTFLEEKGLNKTLREYIINSIAMVRPDDATEIACKNVKNFMVATERYGRSPFLFPIYGCGEFPQSFCRLSAVFGGVYCLNTQLDNIKIGPEPLADTSQDIAQKPVVNFAVQFSESKYEVSSDRLVMDYSSAVALNLFSPPLISNRLSRAILITKRSIVSNSENLVSFLRIPSSERNSNTVFLLEFNSSVMVCPPELNIVYLWTRSSNNSAEDDLSPTVDSIYSRIDQRDTSESDDDSGTLSDATIIWKFYYHQLAEPQSGLIRPDEIKGLHLTSPPSNDIDYENSIKEAESIFHKMCPGEEFLPRAPDPDEIIT